MSTTLLPIRVECYAGYRGEESPRRFTLGTRALEVVDVLDRWLGPDHRYFKVLADDGDVYILRYDTGHDRWELTCFSRKDYLGAGLPSPERPSAPGH